MEPHVAMRSAVVVLGRFPALAGIDLSVDPREIVLLSGPNGAGKTTVLRTCAGLEVVQSGSVTIGGVDVAKNARLVRQNVGYVGHDPLVYGQLTVAENVAFFAKLGSVDVAESAKFLARVGIHNNQRDVLAGDLSSGQRRRLSIAIMSMKKPQLWLLDEPHVGLDQSGRDMLDELVRDAALAGATVMMVSHELEHAMSVASRMIVVDGGMST